MYTTGFDIITQSNCTGMDWSHKLQSSPRSRIHLSANWLPCREIGGHCGKLEKWIYLQFINNNTDLIFVSNISGSTCQGMQWQRNQADKWTRKEDITHM